MIKTHNVALIVVLIIIIEGLAIYLNMVAHPQSQPGLTIFIVLLLALIFGLYIRYIFSKKDKINVEESSVNVNKDRVKYGIGFCIGGAVYSLINMIMNLKKVTQSEILIYNYIIAGAVILGLIWNLILLKKSK